MRYLEHRNRILALILALAFAFSADLRAMEDRDVLKSVYSHFLNALMLEKYGELDQALKEYNRTLELDPEASLIYRQRANLHLKMGNPEKALEDTQAYVRKNPDDVEALLLLANIHLLKGQRAAGKLVLEKVLEKDPDQPEALMTIAMILMADEPDAAVKYFERVIKADPSSAEGY